MCETVTSGPDHNFLKTTGEGKMKNNTTSSKRWAESGETKLRKQGEIKTKETTRITISTEHIRGKLGFTVP